MVTEDICKTLHNSRATLYRYIQTGGGNLAQKQLDLANLFVQRPEFLQRYGASLATADQFVDAVLLRLQNDLGVNLSGQRANLINLYNTQGGRGAVIYRLADDNATTNPITENPKTMFQSRG